ncbi:MAG: YceI family protein [Ilumatobacteraceae bacterium]
MSTTTNPALAALTAGTWTVDASHSTVGFVARHLMVAKTRGTFSDFTGSITVGDNPFESKVEAVVQIASIDTKDEGRDGHLKSADFFDAEHFPTMTLVSTGIEPRGADFVLHADLTVKGVTKSVDFDLEFEGVVADPWGNTKAGFTAEAEINRKDFGLEWNVALETGGVLVGEKVKILLEIEALKA